MGNEFFAISILTEVRDCITTHTGCWYDADEHRWYQGAPAKDGGLDLHYTETHTRSRQRLVKAGLRLGGLPDRALAD